MDNETFWASQANNTFFNEYFINGQMAEWQLIVDEWGTTSVQLKNYLNKYFPNDDKNTTKLGDINVNYILPYLHNRFWTTKDLYRLKYAMKAKIIILGVNGGIEGIKAQYAIECLRLWLRFDSRYTKLNWEGFVKMLNDAYKETEADWYGTVEAIQDKCNQLKPKHKQTLYHYTAEDFKDIQPYMKLNEAYNYWLTYIYPHILDNYKRSKFKELTIRKYKGELSDEFYNELYFKLKADLELIHIKELSIREFSNYIKKFNIAYKKKPQ